MPSSPKAGASSHVRAGDVPDLMTALGRVPDPRARYAGRQVDNVRVPLSSDPRVRQFIYLCQRRFELENTGALADQHGLVELPPGIAKAHRMVMDQLDRLAKRLFRG